MKLKKSLLAVTVLGATASVSLGFAQAATINTTDLTPAGLNLSTGLQNATSPTYFFNDGETVLVIKGSPSAATTVDVISQITQLTPQGYGTISLTNQTFTVPSSSIYIAGPWPISRWNTQTSSTVRVSLSTITGVSVTAVRLPQ